VSPMPERTHVPLEEAETLRLAWPAEQELTGRRGGHPQTGDTTTGGHGRRWWPPLLLNWAGLVVLILVLTGVPTAVRAAPVIGYVMTVPGLACIRLLGSLGRLPQLAFGVGLSLALAVLVAQAMIYLDLWSPVGGIASLVVIGSLASCAELLTAHVPRRVLASPGKRLDG
jgi:hypothetical protein